MSNFEDHLWREFVTEHGDDLARMKMRPPKPQRVQRGARRRRPAFLTGTGLGIASLAAAGMFAFGAFNAGAAYAVTTNPDGTITITLSEFSALSALNQELAQDGVPITAVPLTANCATSRPSGPITVMPNHQVGQDPTDRITINLSQIPTGNVGVIGASQTASGRMTLVIGVATSPGPSCLNSSTFADDQAPTLAHPGQ